MNREQAKRLIIETFENEFNKEKFIKFIGNLLKSYDRNKTFVYQGNYIPEAYKPHISSLERIGQHTYDDKEIDLLIVQLKKETSLEHARTMQRNFIAWYLKGSRGGKLKDAALVAFVSPTSEDWRFSLVKMDYRFEETPTGKIKVREEFTPARRWSFLVGRNEKSHTAQSRFLPLLERDERKPTLEDLEEAFNVEIVTQEFFQKYRDLFIKTKLALDKILQRDKKVKEEFKVKNINTVDFAKKLLGQIVFLYFLQKKGWFGVEKGKPWGSGPKNFLRRLFNREFGEYRNFYNDILEPLFYEALRTDRSADDHYFSRFNCKIPFLNGGLFDPINNFDWVNKDLLLPDELFSNQNRTKEGDIGDGILDVFDRYNFTVNEEEPLEKEVALDPELLGKIYEKLNAIRPDNFDEYLDVLKSGIKGKETKFNKEYGVYYTPREIVHYMCQESLKNYLESSTGIPACDIEKFIKIADSVRETEIIALEREEKIKEGVQKSTRYGSQIPETIKENAEKIDALLSDIKVCDPAVGSGAFLVGMMHEIVKLRQLLSIYCNTDIPVCESNTDIPVCESNTDIPVCEHNHFHTTHRNLPHWTKSGSIYWITFRLADSLSQEKINQWKEEYEIWSKHNPKPWNGKQWEEYNKKFGNKFENWLDSGYGSCILSQPEIREKIKECIMKFDNERLKVHAVVIMPNHVHLLIEPFPGYSLSEILKGIKGASAREINKILGKTGNKIWMEESYDHIVRSEKEYYYLIQYIMNNPIKANLEKDKYWLYVCDVNEVFLPEVAQAFLPVKETQASLPEENKSQTKMSVLHRKNTYDLKRHCIENSLYGVDIDPGAVEICKLRFWLSLVVDEEDFHSIKPLPNLDYKVVCGDALLGVERDLFNQQVFDKLEKLKPVYFNETNPNKKQQLKNEIDKLIFEVTKGHKEFDFEVYFSEVFHKKGGFDVVIENPPYVRQERIKDYKPKLQKANYEIYNSTSDLYTYFYEKSYKIAKDGGFVCLITSNKWMRAKYGEKLRKFLKDKTTIKSIIDFNGYPVFEATVDTNIITFQKQRPDNNAFQAITIGNDFNVQSISKYIKEKSIMMQQSKLEDKCFVLAEDKTLNLKEKIEKIGKPLKEWDVKIYFGIKTGFNDAFIITTEKRNEILANCKNKEERKRTEEIIKPILRGRDIGRYYYKWAGLWVILAKFGFHKEAPKHPAIVNHLKKYETELKNRGQCRYSRGNTTSNKDYPGQHHWLELDNNPIDDYLQEFEKEKIVWQRVTQEFSFCYVPSGLYILDSMAFFTGSHLKYLLGVLNSKVVDWYVKTYVHQYADKGFLLSNQYVERIKVPPITSQNNHIVSQIETLVNQMLAITQSEDYFSNPQKQTRIKELEKQIDQLVYKLYDLTEEEIEIIESGR